MKRFLSSLIFLFFSQDNNENQEESNRTLYVIVVIISLFGLISKNLNFNDILLLILLDSIKGTLRINTEALNLNSNMFRKLQYD